jgi:hypothetical protein
MSQFRGRSLGELQFRGRAEPYSLVDGFAYCLEDAPLALLKLEN